jgi:glycosyltransferase involved in cell wall biosynthesis
MKKKICVVIPCYNVKEKILSVINSKYLSKIDKIVVVDDKCPQNTGLFLKKKLKNNNKIKIIFHKNNLGVGGATISGLNYALKNKFYMIVKVDGDGQHDLSVLKKFKNEIMNNKTDFCKGYRELSFSQSKKKKMPLIRLIGAKSLTVLTRINSGYWELHDPCHGLIGFNYKILKKINLRKIKFNYFFEQDIIMNVVKFNGRIKQFKNEVVYGNESSKLNPLMSIIPFLYYHIINFLKKILKI